MEEQGNSHCKKDAVCPGTLLSMSRGKGNLLIIQGGGPTPVLNASLCAAIDEARKERRALRILGGLFGIHGLLRGQVLDLTDISESQLNLLQNTPGAALGTTRFKPDEQELEQIVNQLASYDVRWLVVIGGNGSLTGAAALSNAAHAIGYDLSVIGAPKTIDNDIAGTDRCPGYGSGARYVAQSVRDLGMDVRSLPQPVSIFEAMGRSVGWLAAAAALAKRDEFDAPHLIYLPEKPFSMDRFVADVDRIVSRQGWAIVVVNEGLRTANGQMVFEANNGEQNDALNRPLPGGVARFLAESASRALKIRCRSEKPGLCGRASMLHVSEQDRADAEIVGRQAVKAALEEYDGMMVALRPLEAGSEIQTELIPLASIAGKDRGIPAQWLEDSDIAVGERFLKYARPLVGELAVYSPPLAELALLVRDQSTVNQHA